PNCSRTGRSRSASRATSRSRMTDPGRAPGVSAGSPTHARDGCGEGSVTKSEAAMDRSFRGVTLRQITEDDLPFLFRLFADPSRCHLWMQGRQVNDERGFHQAWIAWSTDMMRAKFLVESAGRPVGLVFDYDRAPEDGYTKVTALLEENSTGRGGGVIATALLVGWLFETVPLRKVIMEVYGYNRPVL